MRKPAADLSNWHERVNQRRYGYRDFRVQVGRTQIR
jgi:hypothetical protein